MEHFSSFKLQEPARTGLIRAFQTVRKAFQLSWKARTAPFMPSNSFGKLSKSFGQLSNLFGQPEWAKNSCPGGSDSCPSARDSRKTSLDSCPTRSDSWNSGKTVVQTFRTVVQTFRTIGKINYTPGKMIWTAGIAPKTGRNCRESRLGLVNLPVQFCLSGGSIRRNHDFLTSTT